jgi:hypothetical protein
VTDMLMHIATAVTDTVLQMLVGMERRRGVGTEAGAIAGVLVVRGHIVAVAAVVMIVIVMCGQENIADPHLWTGLLLLGMVDEVAGDTNVLKIILSKQQGTPACLYSAQDFTESSGKSANCEFSQQ